MTYKNIFLPLLSLLLLSACSKKMMPTTSTEKSDSTVTTVQYIVKDSLIYLPGEVVEITEMVPCPDVEWMGVQQSETGNTKVTAKISKGKLNVICNTDSLQRRIQWLEAHKNETRTIKEVTTITTPPKRFIPKWVWYVLIWGIGFTAYAFRKPLGGLLKKLLPG